MARLVFWLAIPAIIVLCAFAPIIPALLITLLGGTVSEKDSIIGTLPWLMYYTVPVGAILLLGWAFAALVRLVIWVIMELLQESE